MDISRTMEAIRARVLERETAMYALLDAVWAHPETGYREWNTHALLAGEFESMGYKLTPAGNIPGFYADLDTGREGPTVALLCELDSVITPDHPCADKTTGAVHACGHHAQCAALTGAAWALAQPEILSMLSGRIRFVAVPAEELLELDYRASLMREGVIRYYGGKVEFLYRGVFDGVDMAVLLHTSTGKNSLRAGIGCNGCVTKRVSFAGRAAHAGAAPHLGVNALYAATLAMQAANSLRETFRDDDHIRFHPVITAGGEAVNVIPGRVELESYVRGASINAICDVNERINRAIAGSAAAMGANAHISDAPGYMPLQNDDNLARACLPAMEWITGGKVKLNDGWSTGCTDMGDLSCVMPAFQPMGSGAVGRGHGADYYIENKYEACVEAAMFSAGAACCLLADGAEKARKVVAEAKPPFASVGDYLAAIDRMFLDRDAVAYQPDGTVALSYK